MDVLKDKQTVEYNYISRYSNYPIYYNTQDKKYITGITNYLNDSIDYIDYEVHQGDTFESLAEHFYGRPDYYWIIADYNRIQDPFIDLFQEYISIRIPNLNSITFKQ